jgi:hypothetical protein
MSIYYQKIKNFLVSFFDRDRTKLEPAPDRDWRIMIIAFGIGLSFLINLGLWINWRYAKGGDMGVVTSARPAVIDTKTLDQVAARIDARAREFDRLFTAPLSAVDPSR